MIINKIIENINNNPDAMAIVVNGKSHSYGELGAGMRRVANHLRDVKGCRIGLIANNDFSTYVTILGILFSGNTFIPIVPSHSLDRNLDIIKDGALREIIYTSLESIENLKSSGIVFTNLNEMEAKESELISLTSNQIAYILFTSGSTGTPKGVPISVHNLNSFFDAFLDLNFELSPKDRFLQMFDFSFDLSVFSYMFPLVIGASVYPLKGEQAKFLAVYKTLKDERITFALMVPSIINFLRPYLPKLVFPDLRYSTFCGEALLESDVEAWSKSCPNAEQWNFYGPTEATIFCAKFKCQNSFSRNGVMSIGNAMKDMMLSLFDHDGNQVHSSMTEAELCLAGPQVTSGYLNTSLNPKSFFVSPTGITYYRTGDIALMDENKNFHYCGRVDNQVKIQGFRVELGEIENIASKFTNRNAIAVFERDDLGNAVIALFLEGAAGNEREVKELLSQHISEYALPRTIFFQEQFPLNVNGKIDRKLLKSNFRDYLYKA